MAEKKWKIFFIPQTHWDKEWYFSKNVSDVFLLDNIDKIQQIVERDPLEFLSYTYDGQYSIVDDYLEYYPEREEMINNLIKSKKLIVGPWYSQTDTFNALGESIVRNLLIGITLSKKRGYYLHVGYIPDSFGFNANLPQIFNKFNLRAMIYWRGIDQEKIANSLYNNWIGIDNSELPTFNLYKWGYGMAVGASLKQFMDSWTLAEMPQQAKSYLEKISPNLQAWKERLPNTDNLLLVPFGSDQLPIYDYLQQWMDELNKIDSEHEWKLSTYDEYFDLLLNKKSKVELPKISGELRLGQFSRAHKTITSSRYDIKQKVRELETLIYSEVEPLAVIYHHLGGEYPFNIIQNALKKLLSCQAHDSLGGCNTDNTNSAILNRLQMGLDTMESLATLMKKRIAKLLSLEQNQLLVFNLSAYNQTQTKKMTIFTKTPTFILKDNNGEEINFSVLNQEQVNQKLFVKENSLFADNQEVGEGISYWTEIMITLPEYNALSYHTLTVIEKNDKLVINVLNSSDISNSYYQLKFNQQTGIFDIFDFKNNKLIPNALQLAAYFNAGDTYDFSPSLNNEKIINIFKNAEFMSFDLGKERKKIVVDYLFAVPEKLDSLKCINQKVNFEIILDYQKINLKITIFNEADDIKWQIIFNTGHENKAAYADTAFGIIKRSPDDYNSYLARWEKEKWQDLPVAIEAMESVCFVQNDNDNISVFTKGNNEYELLGTKREFLAVTLFYGSSFIGRRYLKYRPGRASGVDQYPCETPLSNLNKKLFFELQLNYHEGVNVVRHAKEWTVPLCYYQNQRLNEFFWKGDTFVMTKNALSNKTLISTPILNNLKLPDGFVVSAIKKAELSDNIIIRIYNTNVESKKFDYDSNLIEVNLLEEPITNSNKNFQANEVKTFSFKNS